MPPFRANNWRGIITNLEPMAGQDLNQVPALEPARVYLTKAAHDLYSTDGILLAEILERS